MAMIQNRVVTVLDQSQGSTLAGALIGLGEVSVIEKVVGYKKIKFHTHENAGYGDVRLPDMQMHTTAFWLTAPMLDFSEPERAETIDAMHGLGRVLETLATIALMCEPRDLCRALGDKAPERTLCGNDDLGAGIAALPRSQVAVPSNDAGNAPLAEQPSTLDEERHFQPTLYLFDRCPGGVGLAERIYELAPVLLERALTLIDRCPCSAGCPSCVGPAGEQGPRKAATLRLVSRLQTAG